MNLAWNLEFNPGDFRLSGCFMRNLAGVFELISRFRRDAQASIAPIAALTLIPILTAAGAAVDYSRANNFRTDMQTALDVALIAGAKDGSANWTQVAKQHIQREFEGQDGNRRHAEFHQGLGPCVFKATVSGSVPTTVLGIINIPSIAVGARATATASDADDSCILTLDHGQPTSHVSLMSQRRAGDQFVRLLDPLEHLARLQWSRRQRDERNSRRYLERLRQAKVIPAAGSRHLGGARQQHHAAMRQLQPGVTWTPGMPLKPAPA